MKKNPIVQKQRNRTSKADHHQEYKETMPQGPHTPLIYNFFNQE